MKNKLKKFDSFFIGSEDDNDELINRDEEPDTTPEIEEDEYKKKHRQRIEHNIKHKRQKSEIGDEYIDNENETKTSVGEEKIKTTNMKHVKTFEKFITEDMSDEMMNHEEGNPGEETHDEAPGTEGENHEEPHEETTADGEEVPRVRKPNRPGYIGDKLKSDLDKLSDEYDRELAARREEYEREHPNHSTERDEYERELRDREMGEESIPEMESKKSTKSSGFGQNLKKLKAKKSPDSKYNNTGDPKAKSAKTDDDYGDPSIKTKAK